jgi:hypothetical protein
MSIYDNAFNVTLKREAAKLATNSVQSVNRSESIANLANEVVSMTLLAMDYTSRAHALASSIATVQQESGIVFNAVYLKYINTQIEGQA